MYVLDHVTARRGAVRAGLGAGRHVPIICELFADRGTLIARLGAGFTGDGGVKAVPRRELGRGGTELRAIDAGLHGFHVVLFAPCHQADAVDVA